VKDIYIEDERDVTSSGSSRRSTFWFPEQQLLHASGSRYWRRRRALQGAAGAIEGVAERRLADALRFEVRACR
jgi:hypothetical protein